MNKFSTLAQEAARLAGAMILQYYKRPVGVEYKADGSPLTQADQAAHRAIIQHLRVSGVPVISEEGVFFSDSVDRYWLVDPLDGTKDFLAQNDEFAVNIALVEEGRPVLGVVYAPALDILYYGEVCSGAFRVSNHETRPLLPQSAYAAPRIAVSRFHNHPDVEIFASENCAEEQLPLGSALKYCALAEARADVFPRLVGSSEWDTAAGQAILEAAGGQVLEWATGQPLRYGKEKRRNPRLIALRAPYQWSDFILRHYEEELL